MTQQMTQQMHQAAFMAAQDIQPGHVHDSSMYPQQPIPGNPAQMLADQLYTQLCDEGQVQKWELARIMQVRTKPEQGGV